MGGQSTQRTGLLTGTDGKKRTCDIAKRVGCVIVIATLFAGLFFAASYLHPSSCIGTESFDPVLNQTVCHPLHIIRP